MKAKGPTEKTHGRQPTERKESTNPRHALLEEFWSQTPEERKRRFPVVREASLRYGPSNRTLQLWIAQGIVPAVAIGKKYYVDAKSLEEFLKQLQG